jgi:hypothetical protein
MSEIIQTADSKTKSEEKPSRWSRFLNGLSEGRKRIRIRSGFLKGTFLLVCVFISVLEIYLGSQHDEYIESENTVARPLIEFIINTKPAPEPMTEERARKISLSSNRKGAGRFSLAPRVERIQAISLSDNTQSIPAGSEVKGVLKSGGANGMVKVVTTEALTVDGDQVLPVGSTLMGQGASNDERLFIVFRRAITPDRNQIKIHALAFDDTDRMLGLKGKKISNYAFQLAAGSGFLFLGGMADGMRGDNTSGPFEKKRTTARDAALNGVTVSTSDLSRDVMEGMRNQQSRVEVAHSTALIIIFGDTDAKE